MAEAHRAGLFKFGCEAEPRPDYYAPGRERRAKAMMRVGG